MLDVIDLHPPDDYSHRFFIWHEWIQANGQLTAENVFDYFASSMYYDKESSNEQIRMQYRHTGVAFDEKRELEQRIGIEFVVVHAQPPSLFIIHKRDRKSPTEVKPVAAYFIVNNRIYQSPDIYTLLSNRLLTSLVSLQSSLDVLSAHRPKFAPRTGFVWPILNPLLTETANSSDEQTSSTPMPQDTPAEVKSDGPDKPAASAPRKQQNTALLLNAMRTTAVHSRLPTSDSAMDVDTTAPAPEVGNAVAANPTSPMTLEMPNPIPAPLEIPAKGPPGGGKKKRKRTGVSTPAP